MTDHAAVTEMRSLVVPIVLCAASSPILVSADCYQDHDWSIAMIEKHTYWAAIPHDGKWHEVQYAQCLAMESKTCIPCFSIMPAKISFADTMSPCWAYFAQSGNSRSVNMTSSGFVDFEVLSTREKDLGTEMLAVEIAPPRRVLALKCGN